MTLNPPAPPTNDLGDVRTRRYDEALAAAIADPDPLTAMVGAAASDLAPLVHQVVAAVHSAAQSGGDLQFWESAAGTVDRLLRLSRQLDRFCQLQLRLPDAAEDARHPDRPR